MQQRVIVPGPKLRDVASMEQDNQRSGLTSGQTTSSIGGLLRSVTPSNMSFAPAQ
jgi:hypothetical protein